MEDFKCCIDLALSYLDENHFKRCTIRLSITCYKRLQAYLEQERISYSPDNANVWLNSIKGTISDSRWHSYHAALVRLQDICETGDVRIEHVNKHRPSYESLEDTLAQDLDRYLVSRKDVLAEVTISNHRSCCSRFLLYLQDNDIKSITDISLSLLCSFHEDFHGNGRWSQMQVYGCVSNMLRYFCSCGEISYSLTILLHYLSLGKGCFWNDTSSDVHNEIRRLRDSASTVTTETLHTYQIYLDHLLTENDYSHSYHVTVSRTLDLLILFLDMNNFPYSPEIAMCWGNSLHYPSPTERSTIIRTLKLIEQYHTSSDIRLSSVFRKTPRAFDRLPEWCREPAQAYLSIKTREGWEHSTLDMIRSSICRFCGFLDQEGIRSYAEITTSDIKRFNEQDQHRTPAGKNAYNGRIRKFLLFLGENGYLTNPMLFVALSCTGAPKETVVVVLTDDEMAQLNESIHGENSVLSLRKKAMLLLGLKMGMRASDIVSLRIDDINWESAAIRFIQNKTQVEISLPMPTDVGNALFRYIMNERHSKKVPEIFLSERAPYGPVARSVCNDSLSDALPDRHVEGSGFHVTRKTFATELLRNNVGMDMVVNALGQQNTASVHRYLSLDSDKMRMCALSLHDCGIGGWNNGR